VGYIHVLTDCGAGRHVGAGEKLVGACAQDLQQGLVEPLQAPAFAQPLCQERVDFLLAGIHPADHVVEERNFGVGVMHVLDLAAEAVLVELVEQAGERRAFHMPLVQRLHGGEAGGRAGLGACGRVHFSRSSTDLACAGRPSASASAIAAGPIAPSAASGTEMKLVRFMKSSTDSPLAKRARRPVGRT
jgi:hypothetical protein